MAKMKQTRPPITHMVLLIDNSGSMGDVQNAVVRGFNSFLADQKAMRDPAKLTVMTFNTALQTLIDDESVLKIQPWGRYSFDAWGGTSMYRCVGQAINAIEDRIEPQDKVIFMVMGDGMDEDYGGISSATVKKRLNRLMPQGWTFAFIGLGAYDFRSTATAMGFPPENIITVGTNQVVQVMDQVSTSVSRARVGDTSAQEHFFKPEGE